jgi:hypothetical protein
MPLLAAETHRVIIKFCSVFFDIGFSWIAYCDIILPGNVFITATPAPTTAPLPI